MSSSYISIIPSTGTAGHIRLNNQYPLRLEANPDNWAMSYHRARGKKRGGLRIPTLREVASKAHELVKKHKVISKAVKHFVHPIAGDIVEAVTGYGRKNKRRQKK